MAEKRVPSSDLDEHPCFVSWRGDDQAVTSVGPFSRDRAESLVQVYGRMYPSQTCWVQPVPEAIGTLRLGRTRRPHALPILPGSAEDH
jgi:hypothetical protein